MTMGVVMRMAVIVGVLGYHLPMLYYNIGEVYRSCGHTRLRMRASPANSPTMDRITDPKT
jgi:hypothetical protein